ncbi:hypothetical protein FACS1894182_15210 [Bacteroidia bacterium]|nr:hypothetical protein FACS1894182_15210 [Bacteroidia bacterium]
MNSARAAKFANVSKVLKITGAAGSGWMAYQGIQNYKDGDAAFWDYSDIGIGLVGLGSGAFSVAGYSIPVVGQGVAAYSWFRLWFELGAQYGPSTWYGKDDNHWFY